MDYTESISYTETTVNKTYKELGDFIRETHFLKKLRESPYVVDLLDIIFDKPYQIILPKASCDLSVYLATNTLSLREKKTICHQIAYGVAHIQSAGIYHADYKLENVLVYNETVKICDFAISHYYNKESSDNFTPLYRAPELFLETKYKGISNEYTFACDIWALGLMFYSVIQNNNEPLFGKGTDKPSYLYDILRLSSNAEPLYDIYSKYCNKKYAKRYGEKVNHKVNILEGQLEGNMFSLVSNMLRLDSKKRFTIHNILSHPWFNEREYIPLVFPKNKVVKARGVVREMCDIFILPDSKEAYLAAARYNRQHVNEDSLMNALVAVELALILYRCDEMNLWDDNMEDNELPEPEEEDLILMSTLV